MPSAGYTVVGGLPDRILATLAEHPSGLRTSELSRSVFPHPESRSRATLMVGAECSRLWRSGRLGRTQQTVKGRKTPITRYTLPAPAPATT